MDSTEPIKLYVFNIPDIKAFQKYIKTHGDDGILTELKRTIEEAAYGYTSVEAIETSFIVGSSNVGKREPEPEPEPNVTNK